MIPLLVAGCDAGAPTTVEEQRLFPEEEPIAPYDTCEVVIARREGGSPDHFAACTPMTFDPYPPASGPHYAVWADFRTYEEPVPYGFLVHAMEHGAVVFAHHCEDGCPDVRAEIDAIIADRGVDPLCRTEASPSRFIVTPDPDLYYAIAAIAWEHVYLATCLDPPSLRAFVEAHYGQGPEALCFAGSDRSADGWCP